MKSNSMENYIGEREGMNISGGGGKIGRDSVVTRTEDMLNEVIGLIKEIESRLEIVLSEEMPTPELAPNIQNRVQDRLLTILTRLNILKNRINL